MRELKIRERGPKSNPYDGSEAESKLEVAKLLGTYKFIVSDGPRPDKGIDLLVSLKSETRDMGIGFVIQTKSIVKEPRTNFPSLQIETNNLEYLLDHGQPAMYILYIKETQALYYEWAHDFARNLGIKNIQWGEQGSHVLRFHKVLSKESLKDIYQRAILEGERQRREKDYSITGDWQPILNSIHDEKPLPVKAAFKQLFKAISGITIIPPYIFTKLPPFALSEKSETYYSESTFTLYTDNPKLLAFFQDISNNGAAIKLQDEAKASRKRPNLTREILFFCYYNAIDHIDLIPGRASGKRICIHNFYPSSTCDCEKCRYHRFDFKGSVSEILKNKEKGTYEILRKGYTLLMLGKFKEAYSVYERAAKKFRKEENHSAYFMCKYLLSKGFNYSRGYLGPKERSIVRRIEQINLDDEIYLLKKSYDIKDEIILLFRYLNNGNYLNFAGRALDAKLREIDQVYRNDKFGGSTSQNHYRPLHYIFRQALASVEVNLIMPDAVFGFQEFVLKAFEGMLMLHDLVNESNQRLPTFDNYFLKAIIHHGKAEKIEQLLSKYQIGCLPLAPGKNRKDFLTCAENAINSFQTLEDEIKIDNKEVNHFLYQNQNEILANLCVLLSVVDIAPKDLDRIIRSLLSSMNKFHFIRPTLAGHLTQIINRQLEKLSFDLLEEIYAFSLREDGSHTLQIAAGLPDLLKERAPNQKLKSDILQYLDSRIKSNLKINDSVLLGYYHIAEEETRNAINDRITKRLRERFNYADYYYAAINDVIDYKEFFRSKISAIPITLNEIEMDKAIGWRQDGRNVRLNFFIDLAFKNGENLQDPEFQNLIPDEPYYQWLFSISTFDYSRFNAAWLLYFRSKHYYKEFSKVPAIKEAVKQKLKKKRIPGLVNIYINHLCV